MARMLRHAERSVIDTAIAPKDPLEFLLPGTNAEFRACEWAGKTARNQQPATA